MSYNVTTVLNDIAGVMHGTTVNKLPNPYGMLNRTARAVLADVDPKETQRILQLSQVFNSVADYAAPVDLKGDRIVDIRPQGGRKPWDIYPQGYSQDFDANFNWSWDNKIYTQWNTGVKTLRIEAPSLTAPVTISDTSTTTGWTATTGASTITLDTLNNPTGGGDLVFNLLAGSSSGYIENSTLVSVDLSTHANISTLFLWVYLPTGTAVTSINLRLGSSSANYYNYTATLTQQGTAFVNGWNLIAFPWVSATKTGTPVTTAITYTRITFAYNSALQTGVAVCNIASALGYYFQCVYYSKYLFRDPTTNAFQETLTDATDNNKLINLDTESFNLFFNKAAYFTAQSLQGSDAEYDAEFWDKEYTNTLTKYRMLNPSETELKATTYMSIPKKNYSRFNPRWRQ